MTVEDAKAELEALEEPMRVLERLQERRRGLKRFLELAEKLVLAPESSEGSGGS